MIDGHRDVLPINDLCKAAGVSRSAYREWFFKVPVDDNDGIELEKAIEEIIEEFSGYGYRRVTKELERRDRKVNHKKVLAIMKRKRRFVRTTDSEHNLPIFPNLIREFLTSGINQLWVADLTYIRLKYDFVYLATILDAHSRRVIGWSLGNGLDRELSLSALRMALSKREIGLGLIHHSDRGSQYACYDYIDMLKAYGILISMSRTSNPYDNAKAESFFATLKKEEVYLNEYDNYADTLIQIGRFIEDVYNTKRLHSALGYMPPAEFESKLTLAECLK
jgi:transposase InsO family protein